MSSPSEPEEAEGLTDGANDVVVVEQPDGSLRATEFHVQASWENRIFPRDSEVEVTIHLSLDWQVRQFQKPI